jgi:hypothetical protein
MANCISCGDTFPPQRQALGYNTCLTCGDFAAREVKWTVAPLNKGNYILISNPEDLKGLNPKRIGE